MRVGIGAIYIPQETWKYEEHKEPLPAGRMIKLQNIGEIVSRYPQF